MADIRPFRAYRPRPDVAIIPFSIMNYYIFNSIVYFVIALIFGNLNDRAKTFLNAISAVIFIGFVVITVFKIIEILR